ncbi:MAG TPA: DUF4129 domain-containing protein [Candidatus Elarobacter sp.]|nr:DUF4129 domain-containing protein [Candidatus Elarobacter sp.]
MLRWLIVLLGRLFQVAAEHPAIGAVVRIATIAALALVLARAAYVAFVQRAAGHAAHGARRERGTDWAATAQRFAAEGRFTDAAHALYLALLSAAARRGVVTLHESKTAGDYLRELRRKHGPFDVGRFAEFTRSYETVIYGIGECDADRYARLESLADTLLGAAR